MQVEDLPGTDPTTEEDESNTEPYMTFATEEEFKKARAGWRKRDVSGRDRTIADLKAQLAELEEASEAKPGDDALAAERTKHERELKKLQDRFEELAQKNSTYEEERRTRATKEYAIALAKEAGVPPDWREDAAIKLMASASIKMQDDGSVAVEDSKKGYALEEKEAHEWAKNALKGSAFLQAKPSPSPLTGAGRTPTPGGPDEKKWNELSAMERMNRVDGIG